MPEGEPNILPQQDIPKPVLLIRPFERFLEQAVGGSFPLIAASVLTLVWANLWPESYHSLQHTRLSLALGGGHITKSLVHWIDEALMAVFFFSVGLEIKREVLVGELASPKKALLPIAAAMGGMVVPASIYALFNLGTPFAGGWGIPMATDIAFSLAALSIIGSNVPFGLKIFLSAFAIADDLGAVLVIALFYTQAISWNHILVACAFFAALAMANILWIRWTLVYVILGIGLWFFILGSGIHATVAGVLVAMCIPASGKYDTATFINRTKKYLNNFECQPDSCGHTILLNEHHMDNVRAIEEACHDVETPLQRMEFNVQPWVSFLILPLFALANAGLTLRGLDVKSSFLHPITLGIFLGLVLGKPAGIFFFTWIASKAFKAPLVHGVDWYYILGASMLGGIGFTMSLFISGLSFSSPELLEISKLGIISASAAAGVLGTSILYFHNKSNREEPWTHG